ncbi:7803_t:CDS:2, partial [Funneliformis geosporum]
SMYNTIMLDWIRDNLKDLKLEDFYKAFNFSHILRRRAICLLDSFKAWTQSTSCELYLLSVKAALDRASHEVTGRNLAYETIKTIKDFTRKINEEKSLNDDEESAILVIEEDEESSSSSESGITPVNLSNIFLATASSEEVKMVNKKPKNKYITRDIAKEVFKTYQVHVLVNAKLTYNDLQDPEAKTVNFSEGQGIDKFLVDCDDDVLQFLNKFDYVSDLDSLGRCLDENLIGYFTSSNDLIYVQNLFTHFFHLYKNYILLQSMSEHEFSAYIWTPLLRNAFLGKIDLKLSCGKLASKSYDKLKEILNIAGRSTPKLDAQEDEILNTCGKKTGDLRKLEYCTKIILTALFFTLLSTSKDNIKDIEVYSLQSNGFCLTISALKYLFNNTIFTMDLQDIEIPRTVEGFSKLILAVKIILSWKTRTKKNTDAFYQVLNESHRCLTKGVFFSPKKITI